MLKNKFLFTFTALTLFMASSVPLTAQSIEDGLSLGPSARPYGVTESSLVDTDYYEYDAQLWAPYDVTSMDGSTRLQSGFYAELDYTYMSFSRPGAVAGADPRNFNTGSDFFWGTDIELGYMSTKDSGWGLNWDNAGGLVFVNGEDIETRNPMGLTTNYNSVGINRQFRQRLSNGGWVEPYIGMKYINLNDRTIEDFPGPQIRFRQDVDNSALGGLLGTRYFRQYGRYRVGSDISLGALYNDAKYRSQVLLIGVPVATNTNKDNNVVPALNFGMQLSYLLTRDVSLRGGVQLEYMWEGIARADIRTLANNPNGNPQGPIGVNTEDFVAAGFSFGIDWKR